MSVNVLQVLLLVCCVVSSNGFVVAPVVTTTGYHKLRTTTTTTTATTKTRLWSTVEPSYPADEAEQLEHDDVSDEELPPATLEAAEHVDGADVVTAIDDDAPSDVEQQDPVVQFHFDSEPLSQDTDQPMLALLQIAASTGRGEYASTAQKDLAMTYITTLEANNPTPEPTKSPQIVGTWELIYSNTQLFRSSPFFMAGRAVCQTQEQAQQYDWFCDMHRGALAISQIGTVRQVISGTRLVSEFEVKAGAVPFLNDLTPFSYSGGLPVRFLVSCACC